MVMMVGTVVMVVMVVMVGTVGTVFQGLVIAEVQVLLVVAVNPGPSGH
jgi:hypothetical protein